MVRRVYEATAKGGENSHPAGDGAASKKGESDEMRAYQNCNRVVRMSYRRIFVSLNSERRYRWLAVCTRIHNRPSREATSRMAGGTAKRRYQCYEDEAALSGDGVGGGSFNGFSALAWSRRTSRPFSLTAFCTIRSPTRKTMSQKQKGKFLSSGRKA